MATDPISGARYPLETDSGDVALWMTRGVNDLSTQVIPRFTTTTARDNAYSAAITAGTIASIANGTKCSVNGVPYRRIGGAWREDRQRIIYRVGDYSASPKTISAGGANQTGITSGVPALASFTLYEASTVSVVAMFLVGLAADNTGAAVCSISMDGTAIGPAAVHRQTGGVVSTQAAVALAAGSHTVSLRVDAQTATVSWTWGNVTIIEGAAE